MNRRSALRLGGLALAGTLGGCSALATEPEGVDPGTGLAGNPQASLEGTPVYLAGDTADLPQPPTTADSLAAAELAIATPGAPTAPLAGAFRNGTAIGFAGGGAPDALATLLGAVSADYHFGTETVEGRPVETTVAVPRGDTAATFQFVREGGWDAPVLDPLSWALDARLPDCRTFVPERWGGARYAPLGSAWIAGRLPSGETYAARTTAARYAGDADLQRLRLRTAVHAVANGGYAVDEVRRVADLPNDEAIADSFPNPHTRNGVEVHNRSDPIEERLDVAFTPANDRARGALTGCCGLTADGTYGYDHRTAWNWTDDRLLGSTGHYGGGSGRGEWHVHP